MRYGFILCAAWAAASAGFAGAADGDRSVAAAPGVDHEMAWDNGVFGSVLSPLGGYGGNDFDIATVSSSRLIRRFRVYSNGLWTNAHWDGFRLGLFAFGGGVPGSMLWGPTWVVGSGTGWVWCDFDVNYTLPANATAFVAAVDQVYIHPGLSDPLAYDTGPRTHTPWRYYGGSWTTLTGNYNLMIRVVVDGNIGVEPASLGRVKAVYY